METEIVYKIVYKVVIKLVGQIDPVGETNEDDRRFENLKVMTELIDALLADINFVIDYNRTAPEYSRKRAADYAIKFQDRIGIAD